MDEPTVRAVIGAAGLDDDRGVAEARGRLADEYARHAETVREWLDLSDADPEDPDAIALEALEGALLPLVRSADPVPDEIAAAATAGLVAAAEEEPGGGLGLHETEGATLAWYGRAVAHAALGDREPAARCVLETFRSGPRIARERLAPGVFTRFVQPRLGRAQARMEADRVFVEERDFSSESLRRRIRGGATFLAGLAAALLMEQAQLPKTLGAKGAEGWAGSDPESLRAEARAEVARAYGAACDGACQEEALRLLGGASS